MGTTIKKIIIALMVITLVACGGGGGSDGTPQSDNETISGNAFMDHVVMSVELQLNQPFDPSVSDYSAAADNDVDTFSITPYSEDTQAVITINGLEVGNGFASPDIILNVGENVIPIVVTAADGRTQRTYTFTINRDSNTNANLSDLHLSSGQLNEAFIPDQTNYTANVPYSIDKLSVGATLEHHGASLTINGTAITYGQLSPVVNLAVGSTYISVLVTAEDGTTQKTYRIAVTRAPPTPLNDNADLQEFLVQGIELDVPFAPSITQYSSVVDNSINTFTILKLDSQSGATIKVNGVAVATGEGINIGLDVGDNQVKVVVTADDGMTQKEYIFKVYRKASTDATLSNLIASDGTLNPAFFSATSSYTLNVENNVATIDFTPLANDSAATIKINGNSVTSASSFTISGLNVGYNIVNLEVTAQDGTTKIYTVTVERAANSNTNLASLSLSTGPMDQSFVATTLNYTETVANDVASLTVDATAVSDAAGIRINGSADLGANVSNHNIDLMVGSNAINIVVTAEDGSTQTYSIDVTREGSADADLSALVLDSGLMNETFSPNTTAYTQMVSNAVSELRIKPTVNESKARVYINNVEVTSGAYSSTLPLNVDDNIFTVTVVAQAGNTKNYQLTVTRQPNSNADLGGLTLSTGTLEPDFSANVQTYTVNVGNSVNEITLTPTVETATSSVTVNGDNPANAVILSSGDNTIAIHVTAESGATNDYTVNVFRALNGNANLDGITLSTGVLSPAFVTTTTAYNAAVANSVTEITLAPSTAAATSSVTVNGGAPTNAVSLNVGNNGIVIRVTAENGTTQDYTVNVVRSSATVKTVCSSGCDYPTIQSAINTVSAGTTIEVQDGTYSESITFSAKNITVTSAHGAATTFITGDGTDTPVVTFNGADAAVLNGFTLDNSYHNGIFSRGLYITASNTPTVSNTIITDNFMDGWGFPKSVGAGMKAEANNGAITLDNVTVNGNGTKWGAGGIFLSGSTLAISGTTHIDNNSVIQGTGGGIYAYNGSSLSINASGMANSTINGNNIPAGNGAGIYFDGSNGGNLSVKGITLSGNTNLGNRGAGMYLTNIGTTTNINNVAITSNTTKYGGGGIYASNADLNINNSVIDDNQANQGAGAGLQLLNGSSLVMSNTSVNNNRSNANGPGLFMQGGGTETLSISNSSFNNNGPISTAGGTGGGMYLEGIAGTTNIVATTVNGNTTKYGGGGIYARNADLNISGSAINDNLALQGFGAGLLLVNGSSLAMSDTSVNNNRTNSSGAGLYMNGGNTETVSISGSTFNNNGPISASGGFGGGIYLEGISGTTSITATAINGNTAKYGGGGLYITYSGPAELKYVELNNNKLSQGSGGGLWLRTGTAGSTLTNVTINDNTIAGGNGGGAAFSESVTVDKAYIQGNVAPNNGGGVSANSHFAMNNSVVTGNVTTFTGCCGREGGGLYLTGSASVRTLTNVTVVGNRAYDFGGIYIKDGGTTTVNNSILYSNSAHQGTADLADNQLGGAGSITLNYSIIQHGWAGVGGNNLFSKPVFVDEQVVTGTTPTSAGDFRLCHDNNTPEASCPDTGVTYPSVGIDSVAAGSAPQTEDILNKPRPSDIIGVGNDGADFYDAGAYEYHFGINYGPGGSQSTDIIAPALSGVVDLELTEGDSFDPVAGVSAFDNRDGDITDRIVITGSVDTATAGQYLLEYSVEDTSGNRTTKNRKVIVYDINFDRVPPVLAGIEDTLVARGSMFDPLAGVSALDDKDGDITNRITVVGSVNTQVSDLYSLTYSVTDLTGNLTEGTRQITVNHFPSFVGLTSSIETATDKRIELFVNAVDEDLQPLSYSASGLPTWLSFSAVTQTLTGTVPESALGTATDITFTVDDGFNSTSQTLQISVIESTLAERNAFRLLQQASFGPTPALINAVASVGESAWIETQLNMGSAYDDANDNWKSHLQRTMELSQQANSSISWYQGGSFNEGVADPLVAQYQVSAWWENALGSTKTGYEQIGSDQLRQRVAFALSELLVVSGANSPLINRGEALATYYDLLAKHAFGNFRDLLGEVARSPAMGLYLSHMGNAKADPLNATRPDENFAREIMQLFSVGLYQLNNDGSPNRDGDASTFPDAGTGMVATYDQTDVEEMAKVMTGWDLVGNSSWGSTGQNYKDGNYTVPMEFTASYHEDEAAQAGDGQVTILGQTIALNSGVDGSGLDAALDILFNHPNNAPHVCLHLIRRLVTSNPSPDYVARVTAVYLNNGFGVRGDLKAVVRAILLDDEARSRSYSDTPYFGKAKEPILAFSQALKAAHVQPLDGWKSKAGTLMPDVYWYPESEKDFSQGPLCSPSVFNFYSDDHIPSDAAFASAQMVAPELQIQSGNILVSYHNAIHRITTTFEQSRIAYQYNGTLAQFAAGYNDTSNGLFLTSFADELSVFELALEGDSNGDFAAIHDSNIDAFGNTPKANAVDALLDHYDLYLLGGKMTPEYRAALRHYLLDATAVNVTDNIENARLTVSDAFRMIVTSSMFMIQK